MAKKIIRGLEAQQGIINGVIDIVDAIKTTMGPAGKCVAIENAMIPPEITRDGATVAKSISFLDGAKNIGAQLVRKAASLTEEDAGDGTSTCSLLIEEFCTKGQRALKHGRNVNEIKSGMLKAENWVKDFIFKNSIPVDGDIEKIRRVATISANNDPEVGNLIVEAMEKVGIDGTITAELSMGLDTTIDITEGMKIERGYSSPGYITDETEGKCILEDCYVFVCGHKLHDSQQLAAFLNWLTMYDERRQIMPNKKPFLLICNGIDEPVNNIILLNKLRGAIQCCVIKDIDFGDSRVALMQDIATKTGATFFGTEAEGSGRDLDSFQPEDLGYAKKIVISADSTIIYESAGNPEHIAKRSEAIKARLNDPTISDYNKTKFAKRLSNLIGGISIIKAGGATEVEKVNRKQTIEDAILASKSAIAEGVVPGGGYIYYRASLELEKDKAFWATLTQDEAEGARILIDSLAIVLKTVASNAGESSEIALDTIKKGIKKSNYGFNAKTKKYEDLIVSGVLDSAKVIRVALENSVSTASMILTTDCILLDEDEKKSTDLKL